MVKAQPATDCWKSQRRNPHGKTLPALQKTAMTLQQRLLGWSKKKKVLKVEFPPLNNNNVVCSKHDSSNTHFQKQHQRKRVLQAQARSTKWPNFTYSESNSEWLDDNLQAFRLRGTKQTETAAKEAYSTTKPTMQQQSEIPDINTALCLCLSFHKWC